MAPGALRADVASALALIGAQPSCGAPTISSRHHGVRRILLARIDYHLYYRVAPRLH